MTRLFGLRGLRTGETNDPAIVAERLALLTVALISTLLVVLAVALYLTTQVATMNALRGDLAEHARGIVALYRSQRAHVVPLHRRTSSRPVHMRGTTGRPDEGDEFFLTAVDRNFDPISGLPNDPLLDPDAARRALSSRRPLYTSISTGEDQRFLVFTQPLAPYGSVAGVVQSGASEKQYQQNLHALLLVLLIVGGCGVAASAGISLLVARRALQPIHESMRRQREFVADAAHELRTPLAIMRMGAELGMTGSRERQEAALEQTIAQSAHLGRLVDDLSLLARTDAGVMTIERHHIDLRALARQTVQDIEILAEDQDVTLSARFESAHDVIGDPGRLRQLLMIMLDNALKYTPAGGNIEVVVRDGNQRVILEVADSGPGIDPQDLPHIFDRFYRADRARTRKGSGLGLAIARWIAEAHEGNISAQNKDEGGAIFTVSLPGAPRISPDTEHSADDAMPVSGRAGGP